MAVCGSARCKVCCICIMEESIGSTVSQAPPCFAFLKTAKAVFGSARRMDWIGFVNSRCRQFRQTRGFQIPRFTGWKRPRMEVFGFPRRMGCIAGKTGM